jgi:hypothetical protein
MGECIDCPRDCTCLDCRCSVEVGAQGELGLRAGQLREAAFTVRNTGLLEDTFEVSVSSELDMEWMDRSVELGPGEDEAFAAVLRPSRAGTFPVTVRVASRGARRALERTLVARVTEPALGERALSAISPILRLKDLAELVIVAASLLFAAWRYSSYRRQLGEVSRGAQALQGGYPYPAPPYGGYEGSPWSGRGNV